MNKILLITFLLFPTIGFSQVEWTEFSLHVLSTQLEERELCVNFPTEQTFELIEFDRLVQGSVTIKSNGEEILRHCGLSIVTYQTYQVQVTTNRVCIDYFTAEDFWIRFQISKR